MPTGTTLTDYDGDCTIRADNTVINGKIVNCPDGLTIQAKGIVILDSKVFGHVWMPTDFGGLNYTLSVIDSEIDGGTDPTWPSIATGNIELLRANVHGGHNGLECDDSSYYCSIRDSWIHGQAQDYCTDPSKTCTAPHLGGFLSLGARPECTGPDLVAPSASGRCLDIVGNTIVCDAPVNPAGGGCTGDINIITHFSSLHNVLIQGNLLGASTDLAFCTYGGAGFEYPSTRLVYVDNIFERGKNGHCGDYGPVTNFDVNAAGNAWSNNNYDDGTPVEPAN